MKNADFQPAMLVFGMAFFYPEDFRELPRRSDTTRISSGVTLKTHGGKIASLRSFKKTGHLIEKLWRYLKFESWKICPSYFMLGLKSLLQLFADRLKRGCFVWLGHEVL